MINVNDYLDSWVQKRIDYELQVKGRAKLNNDGWRKLRHYHLANYLQTVEHPFAFLFQLKFKHRLLFQSICGANQLYYQELEKRQTFFSSRS